MTNRRIRLASACLLTFASQLVQAEPLAGKWEKSFAAMMFDGSAYKPWQEPKQTSCMLNADLENLPLLKSRSDMAAMKQEFGNCTVSDLKKSEQSTSWITTCKSEEKTTVMTVTTADREINFVTRTQGDSRILGPDGMKVEMRYVRVGECDGGTPRP